MLRAAAANATGLSKTSESQAAFAFNLHFVVEEGTAKPLSPDPFGAR